MKNSSRILIVFAAFLFVQLASQNFGNAEEPKFPYTGEFNGPYVFRTASARMPDNQKGTIKFSIAADGKIKGEAHNLTLNTKTPVAGAINEDGDLEVSANVSGTVVTFKGTLAKTKKGHIKGIVNQLSGKSFLGSVEMDLTPK